MYKQIDELFNVWGLPSLLGLEGCLEAHKAIEALILKGRIKEINFAQNVPGQFHELAKRKEYLKRELNKLLVEGK